MMKGMEKMDTCVLLRWGRERVCIYFYNYLYEMMKEEEKRSLILYITEKCEKPEKTSCYSVLRTTYVPSKVRTIVRRTYLVAN